MHVLTKLSAVKLLNLKDLLAIISCYIDIQINACGLEMPLCLSYVRLAYVSLCNLPF